MAIDAYYGYVSLLLNCNGADNGTTFTDSAIVPRTVTATNAVTSTAITPKWGSASAKFNGANAYLTAASSPANIAFGSGAFTIECWVYPNVLTGQQDIIDFRTSLTQTTPAIALVNNTALLYVNGVSLITTTQTLNATAWNHLAVCRSGTTTTIYVNGVGASATDNTVYTAPGTIKIGIDFGLTSNRLNGYLDDIRITNGVARYTSNFTPASVITEEFPAVGPQNNFSTTTVAVADRQLLVTPAYHLYL